MHNPILRSQRKSPLTGRTAATLANFERQAWAGHVAPAGAATATLQRGLLRIAAAQADRLAGVPDGNRQMTAVSPVWTFERHWHQMAPLAGLAEYGHSLQVHVVRCGSGKADVPSAKYAWETVGRA